MNAFFNQRRVSSGIILFGILLLGFGLRIIGLNWDDHSYLHPDERFLTSVVSQIGDDEEEIFNAGSICRYGDRWSYFNTQCSHLNPNNVKLGSFAYGTLPVFMVRAGGMGMVELTGDEHWLKHEYLHLVGRAINAFVDTLTILVVFLIGRRMFSARRGLVAAGFYALAVLPIQLSHFWTVDIIAHFFFAVGLYAAVEIILSGRGWAFILFGLATGCALASRINLFPMVVLLPMAVLLYVENLRQIFTPDGGEGDNSPSLAKGKGLGEGVDFLPRGGGNGGLKLNWAWLRLASFAVLWSFVAGFVAALTFRIFQPYAFIGPKFTDWGSLNPKWVSDIIEVSRFSQDYSEGWPPSNQWFERISYVYPWYNLSVWGLGLGLGVVASLSLVWAVYQLLKSIVVRLRTPHAITWQSVLTLSILNRTQPIPVYTLFLVWIAAFFGYQGGIHQMTMRYYLPLYAVLCLLAIWGMSQWQGLNRKALMGVVWVATLVWAGSFTNIYREQHTRLEASRWIVANLPTTVTLENSQGERLAAELARGSLVYPLMTAAKNESYLGEPFDSVKPARITGIWMLFSDSQTGTVNLRLLRKDDLNAENPLASFTLEVDETGSAYLPIAAGDVPVIQEALPYRWHIDVTWEGDQPLRHLIPLVEWQDEDENTQYTAMRFLSYYAPVRYAHISPNYFLEVSTKETFEISALVLPHTLEPAISLNLRIGNQKTTALLALAEPDTNGTLGAPSRYQLTTPLTIRRENALRIQAESPMFITGTAIVSEGAWDDPVPWSYCNPPINPPEVRFFENCLYMNPYSMGYYDELGLDMAEPDDNLKYLRMMDILTKGDYLAISSNRFYDALTRNPERFPFSTRYYDRLFEGQLAYELVEKWAIFPSLGGVTFRDQVLPTGDSPLWLNELESEEAFHVYDHPAVFLFQNRGFAATDLPADFTPYNRRNRLELAEVDYNQIQRAEEPVTNTDTRQITLLWVFGLWLAGWLIYPLVWYLLPTAPLRGFGFGRGIFWVVLALSAWWLTSVTGVALWSQTGLWGLTCLLLVVNGWVIYQEGEALLAYCQTHWRALVAYEGLFLVMLVMGLLLRMMTPDLWHIDRGGEKPMDFAYLNAVLRTAQFPPPNPWLSGFEINYYYFGFVIAAVPIQMGNFAPEVGVNLALASLYAVVAVNVFTLAYAFLPASRPRIRIPLALSGMMFTMLAGNLGAVYLLLNPEPNMHPNRWYWYPTRILGESANGAGGAINEVPLFSFLYGDLHAHIINLLPVTLFIGVMGLIFKRAGRWWGVVLGVLASIIYMTNTWDVLLYVPLGALIVWLGTRSLDKFVQMGMLVTLGGVVTFAPYYLNFTLGENGGLERWRGEQSLFIPFLLTWGTVIGVVAVWFIYRLKALLTPEADSPVEIGLAILGIGVVLAGYAQDSETATTVLCGLFLLLGLVLAIFDKPDLRAVHAGVALIFGLLLAMEYEVVKGDVGRLNTVFKISFQLWLWFGLLLPLLLYYMLVRQKLYVMGGLCILLVSLGLIYPIQALPARRADNQTGVLTLNGYLFMNTMTLYSGEQDLILARDADLTRWMRANIQGFPVIAEWYEREYWWNSRVSTQTGLPSVVGWGNHLRQQYTLQHPEIERRTRDIQLLYTTSDPAEVQRILQTYAIQYIVMGGLEQSVMTPEAVAIFDQLVEAGQLRVVYDRAFTKLYQVSGG